jgi:hypothetical protein
LRLFEGSFPWALSGVIPAAASGMCSNALARSLPVILMPGSPSEMRGHGRRRVGALHPLSPPAVSRYISGARAATINGARAVFRPAHASRRKPLPKSHPQKVEGVSAALPSRQDGAGSIAVGDAPMVDDDAPIDGRARGRQRASWHSEPRPRRSIPGHQPLSEACRRRSIPSAIFDGRHNKAGRLQV